MRIFYDTCTHYFTPKDKIPTHIKLEELCTKIIKHRIELRNRVHLKKKLAEVEVETDNKSEKEEEKTESSDES